MNIIHAPHPVFLSGLSRRKGVLISARTRLWATGVGIFNFVIGVGLFLDAATYNSSRYRVHREIMPISAWAFFWVLGSIWCFTCVITRSVRLWLLTSMISMVYCSAWAACVYVAKLLGEPMPTTALALWGFVLFAYCMGMMAPLQLERKAGDGASSG